MPRLTLNGRRLTLGGQALAMPTSLPLGPVLNTTRVYHSMVSTVQHENDGWDNLAPPPYDNRNSSRHWLGVMAAEAGKTYQDGADFGFVDQGWSGGSFTPSNNWIPSNNQGGLQQLPVTDIGTASGTPLSSDLSQADTFVISSLPNFVWPDTTPTQTLPNGTSYAGAVANLIGATGGWEDRSPGSRYFIFDHYPEPRNWPGGVPTSTSDQGWIDFLNDLNGPFDTWFGDLLTAVRADARMNGITIERFNHPTIMYNVFTQAPMSTIAPNLLFNDEAPHGANGAYLLYAIVFYIYLYRERPPATFTIDGDVPATMANNISTIIDQVWNAVVALL